MQLLLKQIKHENDIHLKSDSIFTIKLLNLMKDFLKFDLFHLSRDKLLEKFRFKEIINPLHDKTEAITITFEAILYYLLISNLGLDRRGRRVAM